MDASADVVIRPAGQSDLEPALGVQHRAFGRVARSYGLDPSALEPVRETCADLEAQHETGTRFFVAEAPDGRIAGAVRATDSGGRVLVGRLVVDDGWLRRGIATRLMDTVESAFEPPVVFELFTGADAEAPLALYRARGYRDVRVDDSGPVTLVWLEKAVAAS